MYIFTLLLKKQKYTQQNVELVAVLCVSLASVQFTPWMLKRFTLRMSLWQEMQWILTPLKFRQKLHAILEFTETLTAPDPQISPSVVQCCPLAVLSSIPLHSPKQRKSLSLFRVFLAPSRDNKSTFLVWPFACIFWVMKRQSSPHKVPMEKFYEGEQQSVNESCGKNGQREGR